MPNRAVTIKHGLSFRANMGSQRTRIWPAGVEKRGICFFLCLCLLFPLTTAAKTRRPKILGISQVRILTTDEKEANTFYYGILRALSQADSISSPCDWCERMPASSGGPIEFERAQRPLPKNLIRAIVFATDDTKSLERFLRENKVKGIKSKNGPTGKTLFLKDPENHQLIFVQTSHGDSPSLGVPGAYGGATLHWPRILHAGFVVKDRAAEDHFYKDILGFRPYWHGGMKDDRDDWVSLQVPDGSAWVEFMLNIPDDASQRTLGIMNHVAFGVIDMQVADRQLLDSPLHLPINEEPKIGRDGKWQLNVYDPDDTRIEFMEFTPKGKTCCSQFTAPHPKP